MPALSSQGEWLDKLLSGAKQQITRQQTDRIRVGDVVHIYNQQRRRIVDKSERKLTGLGFEIMNSKHCMSMTQQMEEIFHAHFLGKVVITEVYDVLPIQCTCGEEAWAKKDGFVGFGDADTWFTARYGEGWVDRWWTVIRWNGWLELYFEPECHGRKS